MGLAGFSILEYPVGPAIKNPRDCFPVVIDIRRGTRCAASCYRVFHFHCSRQEVTEYTCPCRDYNNVVQFLDSNGSEEVPSQSQSLDLTLR